MRIEGDVPDSVGESIRQRMLTEVRMAEEAEIVAQEEKTAAIAELDRCGSRVADVTRKLADARAAYAALFGEVTEPTGPEIVEREMRKQMRQNIRWQSTIAAAQTLAGPRQGRAL